MCVYTTYLYMCVRVYINNYTKISQLYLKKSRSKTKPNSAESNSVHIAYILPLLYGTLAIPGVYSLINPNADNLQFNNVNSRSKGQGQLPRNEKCLALYVWDK